MGSEVAWSGPRPLRRARPRLHRAGPGRHPARRRGRAHRPGRTVLAGRGAAGRPAGGVGQGRGRPRAGTAGCRWRVAGCCCPSSSAPRWYRWTRTRCAWEHVTHSFGEPYGAQRGGVEVSICGPPDAVVHIACGGRPVTLELAKLAGHLAGGRRRPRRRARLASGRTRAATGGRCAARPRRARARRLPRRRRCRLSCRDRVLLRPGVPGGRRDGVVLADLGVERATRPRTGRAAVRSIHGLRIDVDVHLMGSAATAAW